MSQRKLSWARSWRLSWPRDAKTCAHSEHFNGVAIGGSRIRRGWETLAGPGSSFDTVSSSVIPTETSLDWEGSRSEVAEDDGKSDTGQFKSTISLDAEDNENLAVEGVNLSATADCSKLGSEGQALSLKLKSKSIRGSLEKVKSQSASGSPTSQWSYINKGRILSWTDCTEYGCCSSIACE